MEINYFSSSQLLTVHLKVKIVLELHPEKRLRYSAGAACSVIPLKDPECKGMIRLLFSQCKVLLTLLEATMS